MFLVLLLPASSSLQGQGSPPGWGLWTTGPIFALPLDVRKLLAQPPIPAPPPTQHRAQLSQTASPHVLPGACIFGIN